MQDPAIKSMKSNYIIILTTFSKLETGEKITSKLLMEKLAACIQSFPINSSYIWKGEICRDAETLLLIKTKSEHYVEVEQAIKSVHDYETPEVVAMPIEFGFEKYLAWIEEVTK